MLDREKEMWYYNYRKRGTQLQWKILDWKWLALLQKKN
jgi:hypothetical protein